MKLINEAQRSHAYMTLQACPMFLGRRSQRIEVAPTLLAGGGGSGNHVRLVSAVGPVKKKGDFGGCCPSHQRWLSPSHAACSFLVPPHHHPSSPCPRHPSAPCPRHHVSPFHQPHFLQERAVICVRSVLAVIIKWARGFSFGAIRCSFNTRFRARFRRVQKVREGYMGF